MVVANRFISRPKSLAPVLWVIFELKDGTQLEGVVANDLLTLTDDLCFGAIKFKPRNNKGGKDQMIGVELIDKMKVLGVIHSPRRFKSC